MAASTVPARRGHRKGPPLGSATLDARRGLPGPRARGLARGLKALSHPCPGSQGPSFAAPPCPLRLRSAHCH
eukprot:8765644-Pyramimonas_sp.AAC.1